MEYTDGVVTIRRPTDADLPMLADAIRTSQAELAPFMPWAAGVYDEQDTLAWIGRSGGPDEHGFVIVDPDGRVIGTCGLSQFSEINGFANLGYWVRTSHTGKGYATRATRVLAQHGFDEHGLARIEITMSTENEASRRVAERAGAHHEGVMRNRLLLHGRHHDAHLFSLLPGEVQSRT